MRTTTSAALQLRSSLRSETRRQQNQSHSFIKMSTMMIIGLTFQIVLLMLGVAPGLVNGQFQWHTRDAFDEIRTKMDGTNADNCQVKFVQDIRLDDDVLSHLPDVKKFEVNPVFPNRTALLHVHNMAMSRAFYYSFILQSAKDDFEPGMMYYILSTVADVAANPRLNASAIYFAPNTSYTPSYRGFFNKTFPLFAPRAFRADDFNDPFHLQRVSTMNTIEASDLGAIQRDQRSLNYSQEEYRINQWYTAWLPDATTRQDSKATYQVLITHADDRNETLNWHGPPGSEEPVGPVKWVRPYFDCGRSNKWVTGATSPIPDIYPRHTGFRHIEIPKYVAVAVMETDFERVDINQCPKGKGNLEANKFVGTARCKEDTTECEPLQGYGFRRGGYQCRCKPGYRLPFQVRQPYLGDLVERATQSEYENRFQCLKVGYQMIMPQNWEVVDRYTRRKYIGQYQYKERDANREIRAGTFYDVVQTNISRLAMLVRSNASLMACNNRPARAADLEMPGDMNFGVDIQFENEARTALRLANFLSAFLQIVDPNEKFGELRLADQPLTDLQMFGEVVSTVMGNVRIWGAGVFFDRNKFTNRTYFAPYAYKKDLNPHRNYFAEDLTRRKRRDDEFYPKKRWFRQAKTRWSTGTDDLEEFILKIRIRGNSSGEYRTKYDHFPVHYRAAELRHGTWTAPYFDCELLHRWVVSYVAPFFGWDSIRNRLEFKGVVTTTVLLEKLDINQCSEGYSTTNAFKNTHKCEQRSSMCIPMLGRGFEMGGYKCECEQGYEYPFGNQIINYFDGQLLEADFQNLIGNVPSRFDMLKCRLAAAASVDASAIVVVVVLFLVSIFMTL